MEQEFVILVDDQDTPIGIEEKLKVHQKGLLHRAFSIFIFNQKRQLLLQKRNLNKYHCGGMWTNTCCSHPRPSEKTIDAAHRRLKEEMGFDCELVPAFSFPYKAELGNKLIEHEFDHVFLGIYNRNPRINKNEASDWKYIDIPLLRKLMRDAPGDFTPWLHLFLNRMEDFSMKYFDEAENHRSY